MDLPSKEKTFEFSHTGLSTGRQYDGRFTVLCLLNVGQKHLMALEETRLLGSYSSPTPDLEGLAMVLSNLRAKIVDGPEWWKQSNGGNIIDDEDVLVQLYQKVKECEAQWKTDLMKKAQAAQD